MISVLHLSSSDLLICNNYPLFNYRVFLLLLNYLNTFDTFLVFLFCFFLFPIIPIFCSPIRYTLCVSIYCFAFTMYTALLIGLLVVPGAAWAHFCRFADFPINFLSIILSKSFQTLRREMIAAVWKMSRVSVWKLNLRKSFENVFIHLRSECFYFFLAVPICFVCWFWSDAKIINAIILWTSLFCCCYREIPSCWDVVGDFAIAACCGGRKREVLPAKLKSFPMAQK